MNKKKNTLEVDLLVKDHQELVYHLAMRVYRRLPVKHDLDDLIGYGMIGLVEAAKKYQKSRGVEFTTFAYPRINGAIYDGVSKLSWMSRSRYNRLRREQKTAEAAEKQEPQHQTHTDEIGMVRSFDPESAEIEYQDESNVVTQVARTEELQILGNLISELPNRENRLITMIYVEGLTLQVASERLGISKSWASRMHRKTLTRLAIEIRERTQ